MIEHQTQAGIVQYLHFRNVMVFETDVMGGLQFFSHTDKRRFAFINHHKNMGYIKGQPDLVILLQGKTIFVEVKKDKTYQTPEQKDFEAEVKKLGQEYYVWRSIDDAKNYLDNLK